MSDEARVASFIVITGSEVGRRHQLAGRQTVGSGDDCNIHVDGNSVDKEHCLVITEGDSVRVRDLGSRHGVFVNGKRKHGQTKLRAGEQIQIGECTFELAIGEAADTVTDFQNPAANDNLPSATENTNQKKDSSRIDKTPPKDAPRGEPRPAEPGSDKPAGSTRGESIPSEDRDPKPASPTRDKRAKETNRNKPGQPQRPSEAGDRANDNANDKKDAAGKIRAVCPKCKAVVMAPKEWIGKKGRCKKCGNSFLIGATEGMKAGAAIKRDRSEQETSQDHAALEAAASRAEPASRPVVSKADPATTQPDAAPTGSFILAVASATLLCGIGAIAEAVVAFGHPSRDLFAGSALGCVAIALGMLALGAIGFVIVSASKNHWLRLVFHVAWSFSLAMLLLMFLVPGWSYAFPYAPYHLVQDISNSSPMLVASVLVKYVTLFIALLALHFAIFGSSSPVRATATTTLNGLARIAWLPAGALLWIGSISQAALRRLRKKEAAASFRTFDSLPPRYRRTIMAGIAFGILGALVIGGMLYPAPFRAVGSALFRNEGVGEFLASITPPMAQPPVEPDVVASEIPPHLPVGAHLVSVTLMNGDRKNGWLDDSQFLAGNMDIDVHNALGQAQEISVRDLFSIGGGSQFSLVDEQEDAVVPGSFQWLEDDERLKRELPFDIYVACKIAQAICKPSAPIVRREDNRAIVWVGNQLPGNLQVSEHVPVSFLSPGGNLLELKNLGRVGKQALRVEMPGAAALEVGGNVLLGSLDHDTPRPLILNIEVDAREAERDRDGFFSMARATGISEDVVQSIQFDRWGRVFNERVRNHLRGLNVKAATDRMIQTLQSEGLVGSQGQFADDKLTDLRKHATHVISTRFVSLGRPDRCAVTVTYKDLTGGLFDDELSMNATINIEDLYPEFREIYKPSQPVISGEEFVRVVVDGKPTMAQFVNVALNRATVEGGEQVEKAAQTTPDPEESGDVLVRVVSNESYVIASHLRGNMISRDDISSEYVKMLHNIARSVSEILSPPVSKVVAASETNATVSVGSESRLATGDQVEVRRIVSRGEGFSERRICQCTIASISAGQVSITLPDKIDVRPGDLVFSQQRPRVNLVIYPLELSPTRLIGNDPRVVDNFTQGSAKIAEDLRHALAIYGVPMLADLDFVRKIDGEFARPGLNPELSIRSGNRIGATHVLSGKMTPYKDASGNIFAEVTLGLTELETTRSLPFATVKIPANLGRNDFDFNKTIDLLAHRESQ